MVKILNVHFGIVNFPKLFYNYDLKGRRILSKDPSKWLIRMNLVFVGTDRTNTDQDISSIESQQQFHLLKTEKEK